jgi:hypothetical protein
MTESPAVTAPVGPAPASTLAEVIQRMKEIDAALDADDGVACFNRLYLEVTQVVLAGVEDRTFGMFEDPNFVSALDVNFANLYFGALCERSEGHHGPRCWRPLLEGRQKRRAPAVFALCGMNAHINHDLPVAVVATARDVGVQPVLNSPQHRDFMAVNNLLRLVEEDAKRSFLTGRIAEGFEHAGAAGDKLTMWSISDAREVAWHQAETLWRLTHHHPHLAQTYEERLSELADWTGRWLLR